MDRNKALINILSLSHDIGNKTLIIESIKSLAEEYGIRVTESLYRSVEEIPLYTPVVRQNHLSKVSAIKELREKAHEHGLNIGLKEAKDEVDRRIKEATYNTTL